ncbi:MAG TPA: carboxypeptidase-like regulatory domain-containing protein [Chthoniobacterales bacterium]
MKNMIRSSVLSLLLIAASMAYGAVPAISVTVSDAGGKAAFKGMTNAKGTFATANLKPGNYVVQFNSTSGAVKGNLYAIVVSAGTKKVSAAAVPGEKFAGGGVALKVDVGAGLNITGQVAAEANGAVKNGKKMVWIPPQAGSHFPGHWVEEGSAEAVAAKAAGNMSTQDVSNLQQRMHNQGGN